MKARVIATGVELEVHLIDKQVRYIGSDGVTYLEEDLDFGTEDKDNTDYWTRLEHQYAGMAMQGIMSYIKQITPKKGRSFCDEIVDISFTVAHALVEKLKEKEERK